MLRPCSIPTAVFVSTSINENQREELLVGNAVFPHTETKKPVETSTSFHFQLNRYHYLN